jgi:hypothetical protein
MTAVMREESNTGSLGWLLESPRLGLDKDNAEGITSDTHDIIMSDVKTPATSMLISTDFVPRPGSRKHMPGIYSSMSFVQKGRNEQVGLGGQLTNKIDDRMLPIMLD